MISPAIKKWAWLPLAIVAIGLIGLLIFVATRNNSTKHSSGSTTLSTSDAQLAARNGKTEQLTLVSQQGSFPYRVEIASTDASRQKGLSGRDGLAPNAGMLFVFGDPGYDCFWMKDMKFDIDMLWFDEYQSLIHVQENASKSTYPSSFCPQGPAKYVLEVPAGTVKQLGLQIGDRFLSQ